jgi:tyrosine-protein kinase Etk/Wzc
MQDPFQTTVKKEATGLDVKELFYKYVRFLPLILFSVLLSLVAAYLYLRYTTPIYRSEGALMIRKDNNQPGSGGAGADQFQQMFVLDNSINIQNEIELIRSRPVMARVVESLELNISYYSKGKIGETNIYKSAPFHLDILQLRDSSSAIDLNIDVVNNHGFRLQEDQPIISFGQAFDWEGHTFRLVRNAGALSVSQYKINWQPTGAVASQFVSELLVAPKGATGTLLISLDATHPQLAADVVNQLMKEYQVVTREDKNETNQRMLAFIDGRLADVQKELDTVTRLKLSYQNANNIIDPEAQSASYFSRIEETDLRINEQRVQDEVAGMIDRYLRNQGNNNNLVPSTLGLQDPTLSTLIGAYNVAQLERKALLDANVPATNPVVAQKQDQIERLRINILESLSNLRRSIAASIANLEQTGSAARSQIRSLPAKEQNLAEIQMQQATKQAVFNLLMEKREQTAIALAGTISNMRVVEQAGADPMPVEPNRRNVYLIAFVAGLAIPALSIFALEALNDKINNRQELEKLIRTPVVGEVGHSFGKEALVVKPNTRGLVAEQFRIIRSNLQYFLTSIPKPVILVTSSFSGEGKSFISTNLGAVMSLANKKTIILEFDIRKPKVLAHLNIPKKPGLTNYLLGKVTAGELPVPVPNYDNLFVLPCGPVPPNPAELLLDPKLDELFAYLREAFDVIVIDTAPVGMVSDATALSRFADSTLYIVRQGYTFKKQIRLIDELHANGQLPKVSIVLNDIKMGSGYGYYGRGNYGYGYGAGYFDEEKPPVNGFFRWFGWMDVKSWKKKEKIK